MKQFDILVYIKVKDIIKSGYLQYYLKGTVVIRDTNNKQFDIGNKTSDKLAMQQCVKNALICV